MAPVAYVKLDLLLSAVSTRGANFFLGENHAEKCRYLEFLLKEHPDMVAFGMPQIVEGEPDDSQR